jgi:outer membrane receptor protein involved in Fe transport
VPLDAEGFTLFDAMAGYRYGDVELAIDVRNLFDAKWKETQFATTSRLQCESAPRQDINFTPGWPFTAMVRATAYF